MILRDPFVTFHQLVAELSAFKSFVALAVITAAFLNPFQAAVAAARLIDVVLIEAGLHAGLASR